MGTFTGPCTSLWMSWGGFEALGDKGGKGSACIFPALQASQDYLGSWGGRGAGQCHGPSDIWWWEGEELLPINLCSSVWNTFPYLSQSCLRAYGVGAHCYIFSCFFLYQSSLQWGCPQWHFIQQLRLSLLVWPLGQVTLLEAGQHWAWAGLQGYSWASQWV